MIYAIAVMSGLLLAWLFNALLFWDGVKVSWIGVALVLLAFGWSITRILERER